MDVFRPVELEEALRLKDARNDIVPICGGTDVMVDLNFRRKRPASVMDLSGIKELSRWREEGDYFYLGAGVTYTMMMSRLPAMPPLAAAARTIGSPQIRNRGTAGGNLGTASPAGDILPVLASFDAEVIIGSAGARRRTLAWDAFLTGPKRNALESNELILAVRWRPIRGPGIFAKVGARNAMVIAITSISIILDERDRHSRIAVGAVAPTVIRLPDVEKLVDDTLASAGAWDDPRASLDAEAVEEAANVLRRSIAPIDDLRASAAYRRHACSVLLKRALAWALQDRAESRRAAC